MVRERGEGRAEGSSITLPTAWIPELPPTIKSRNEGSGTGQKSAPMTSRGAKGGRNRFSLTQGLPAACEQNHRPAMCGGSRTEGLLRCDTRFKSRRVP